MTWFFVALDWVFFVLGCLFVLLPVAVGLWAIVVQAVKPRPPVVLRTPPRWVVVPVYDAGDLCGFRVAWSERDTDGRMLLVGHYIAAEDGLDEAGPSLRWCEHAANRMAEDYNRNKRAPWEFNGWRNSTQDGTEWAKKPR